jgi:hypothetical protein
MGQNENLGQERDREDLLHGHCGGWTPLTVSPTHNLGRPNFGYGVHESFLSAKVYVDFTPV